VTTGSSDEGLAAALIQISAHAERIASLDGHYQNTAARLNELAAEVTSLASSVDEISGTLSHHGAVVEALDGLDTQVAAVARRLADLADDENGDQDDRSYQPVLPPRWWKITGPERDTALTRLRAWVDQVYPERPQPAGAVRLGIETTGHSPSLWRPRALIAGRPRRFPCSADWPCHRPGRRHQARALGRGQYRGMDGLAWVARRRGCAHRQPCGR
jgi:hypothetical protein